MSAYDFIGDIHGYYEAFETLLYKLGYQPVNGVWQNPERTLVVLGDMIDRGPSQKLVVDLVRKMVEHGKAIAIMGNHEFYAIAWTLKGKNGEPLRPHSDKNLAEHAEFLLQASVDSKWYSDTIEWFKTLPLFADLENCRAIHAAWSDDKVEQVQRYTKENGQLFPEFFADPEGVEPSFYKALEYCLNGPKITLPQGAFFIDSAGKKRIKMRLKWWDIPENPSYQNACTSVPEPSQLPDEPLELASLPVISSSKPIFFGHYWMQGKPRLMSDKMTCLDFSVVQKGGSLAAYRYDGEEHLDEGKLIWVENHL